MSEIKALEKLRKLKGEVVDYRWGVDFDRAIDELETEIEREWIRAPVDAYGVPIRVGDVMENFGVPNSDATRLTVAAVGVDSFAAEEDIVQEASMCWRHYKPRTLEDIVYEIALDSVEVVKVVNGTPVLGINRGQLADELEIHADEILAMFEEVEP